MPALKKAAGIKKKLNSKERAISHFIVFFLFFATPFYGQFDAGRWSVKAERTLLYREALGLGGNGEALPYAYTFKAKGARGARVSLMQGDKEFWVETNQLARIDFNSRNFSVQGADFLPSYITDTNDFFLFIYKDGLYRLNIKTLDPNSLSKVTDTPSSAAAYFSEDDTLVLLSGVGKNGLHLAFLYPQQKKFLPLTVLSGDASLISAAFSPKNKYLALHISLFNRQRLLIFRIDTGELLSTVENVTAFRWVGEKSLIAVQPQSILRIQPEQGETLLYAAPRGRREIQAVIGMLGTDILIDIEGVVYRLDGDGLEKMSYTSIERTSRLQRVEQKGSVIFTYDKKTLRPLSGRNPQWDFISFAGEESLVYSQKSATGAITTLYYYDAAKDQSLPYHWIEEPIQVLPDGLAYEAVDNNEGTWLFFEKPSSQAQILWLDKILR